MLSLLGGKPTLSLEQTMSLLRWTARTLPLVTGFIAITSSSAAADQPLFTWAGTVDREVYIVMHGNDISTQGRDANLPYRARVNSAIPRGRGDVEVRVEEGRGNVAVIEQPSARNGYQTVIRVQDPSGGADRYRLTAYWRDNGYFDRDDRDVRDQRDRYEKKEKKDKHGRDQDDYEDRRDDGRRDDGPWDNRNPRAGDIGGPGALRWSGRVDDVAEIRIQGRRVDMITRSGAPLQNVNSDIVGAGLPRRDVRVDVDQRSGRGSVYVVQQPNASNGFTAIIRLEDRRSGAAFYDFSARW